jgi:hypothetical protein
MNEFKIPKQAPDLEVELSLFPTDQGGRKQPLWQGCRLPHDFGLPEEMNDGMYAFDGEPPEPGATQRAKLWLLAPERNQGRLYVGFEYLIWEGRTIGKGRIIEVINPLLRSHAEQRAPGDSQKPRT